MLHDLQIILRTINQILSAGIAITAFALFLYALTFNLRDRVARSFALILMCVVVAFSAETIGSSGGMLFEIDTWLRAQWIGIIFLPAAFLHFSDALLSTTGQPSRGKRRFAIFCSYCISGLFLLALLFDGFVGPLVIDHYPSPSHLRPTWVTNLFTLYYLGVMAMSWYNFARAYLRTTTPTSRRRMAYLITGAIAPAAGSFPFMMYGSDFALSTPTFFWLLATLVNIGVGGLIVVMAYAVAFFGVPWPDRVVKSRLFKWLMRGPVTAIVTLALATFIRRLGEQFGAVYTGLVPMATVLSILLMEYMITLLAPFGEKVLFYGNDRNEMEQLRELENRLVTRNDLRQFMEMILSAVCDRLQAAGAYVIALEGETMELVITIGSTSLEGTLGSEQLARHVQQEENLPEVFDWGNDYLIPLKIGVGREIIGLLGISRGPKLVMEDENLRSIKRLIERAASALNDRRSQEQIFSSLEMLNPQMEVVQRARLAGRYDEARLEDNSSVPSDLTQWVKEALTHYWGGPKLVESPLLQLQVVQDAVLTHEGNNANALRAILREAIDRVRPEGDRRFTAEWILFNILEMKFMEGKKVREIALRLAMSEADLYRKQRVAIEAVSRAILDMEAQARRD
jgi:hypothetical protein